MDDLTLLRPGIPDNGDNCPVLTRINAFIGTQGVRSTLEFTVRDEADGHIIDLSSVLPTATFLGDSGNSLSLSEADGQPGGTVLLRAKEFLAAGGPCKNPIWEIKGWSPDPGLGLLRVRLPQTLVDQSGIYELSWAVKDDSGAVVLVREALLSVERSLFPSRDELLHKPGGCLTIQEVRLSIRDDPASNLLLDDFEFSPAELCQAIGEPIRYWNEALPPVSPFTTRNFPYRGAWLSATAAWLYRIAAASYRRNTLKNAGAGIQQSDKDKEQEYLAEGTRLWKEYRDWVQDKKVSLNLKSFVGYQNSPYTGRYGW